MEGSIYNIYGVLWTNSNVFWDDKFTSHILGNDEQNLERPNKQKKVVAFVDNVLVGTETEEGYNEIVNEILKRLKENDFYIKLEKYV